MKGAGQPPVEAKVSSLAGIDGAYQAAPQISNYVDAKLARHVASGMLPQTSGTNPKSDEGGPTSNLEYAVAHGNCESPARGPPPAFILVKDAGTGEADGIYKPENRKWAGIDVYANRYG
jgi:hypothetical protein